MSFLTDEEEDTPIKSTKKVSKKPKLPKLKAMGEIKGVFSAIFSGMKGTSKSTTAYSINNGNGKFVVLDFDGNSERVINLTVDPKKVKNYTIYNIKERIDYAEISDPYQIPPKAYAVYEYVEDIIYNQLNDMKPNFIIFDGFQRWVWVCEMAMRKVHMAGKNPFTDGGNWNMWKERNFYVDRSFQGAQNIATDAVLFTVHEVEKERAVKDVETGEYKKEPYKEPTWMSTVKEETDIVIESQNISLGSVGGGNKYEHHVRSNKVTGIESTVDVTNNPVALWDEILAKKIEPLIK